LTGMHGRAGKRQIFTLLGAARQQTLARTSTLV
jgi:hypothetical protein